MVVELQDEEGGRAQQWEEEAESRPWGRSSGPELKDRL